LGTVNGYLRAGFQRTNEFSGAMFLNRWAAKDIQGVSRVVRHKMKVTISLITIKEKCAPEQRCLKTGSHKSLVVKEDSTSPVPKTGIRFEPELATHTIDAS
jgi:hypothetical protein